MTPKDAFRQCAQTLHLHGLLAYWPEIVGEPWVERLILWEEQERSRRSLERRLQAARIGRFKPLCDFDWTWPKRCDRSPIEALMSLDFLQEAANVVLIGPNGVGKSLLAQNLAHQALVNGATVLFTTGGQMLGELAALDSDSGLRRRLRHYAAPDTSWSSTKSATCPTATAMPTCCSNWSAGAMKPRVTLVTTNRAFADWHEVFPNAACVVSLVDRLIHNAEVIAIEGESYRLKEARERAEQRARRRRKKNGDAS